MKTKLSLILFCVIAFLAASCNGSSTKKGGSTTGNQNVEEAVPSVTDTATSQTNVSEEPIVEIETTMGTVKLMLYKDTPIHRDNFVKLAQKGFFDGLLFHRVINEFMVQGGDPTSKDAQPGQMLGSGDPGYTLPAEIKANHYHKRGALAAARTGDDINPYRESSGSQFYIVHGRKFTDQELDVMEQRAGITFTDEQRVAYKTVGGAPFLDGGYTVYGEVLEGLNVIDAIAGVETDGVDRPLTDVKIVKVTVIE